MKNYKNNRQKYGLIVLLAMVMVVLAQANLFAAGQLHISEKDIDKIAQEVSKATGLELKEFPKVEVVSASDYLKELGYEAKEMITQFSLLGHKPFNVSFNLSAATYSWYSGRIYCIREYVDQLAAYLGISASGVEKISIAREMVRAVDHQHFDFEYYLRKMNSTGSLQLLQMITQARGYQILSQIYPKLGIGNAEYKKYFVAQNPEFNKKLPSYEKIIAFLNYVAGKGVTVEALYNNPPLDGVQILYPEKYLAGEEIAISTVEDFFTEEDFTLKLPWHFRYATCQRADFLSMYDDLAARGGSLDLLNNYADGIFCTFGEKIATRPKNHYPIDRNSISDISKGLLTVSMYKFTTADAAKKLAEHFIADGEKVVAKENDEYMDYSIDKIKAKYPDSYSFAYKGKRGDTAVYLLITIDSVNLIELNLLNMNPTEEQIMQAVDLVLERMKAQATGATDKVQ